MTAIIITATVLAASALAPFLIRGANRDLDRRVDDIFLSELTKRMQ